MKVAGLANEVMDDLPAGVGDGAEDGLEEPAQRAAGVVGAEDLGRFQWR